MSEEIDQIWKNSQLMKYMMENTKLKELLAQKEKALAVAREFIKKDMHHADSCMLMRGLDYNDPGHFQRHCDCWKCEALLKMDAVERGEDDK